MDVDETYVSRLLEADPEDIDESIVDKLILHGQIIQENDLEFFETVMKKIQIDRSEIRWTRPWYQLANQFSVETIKASGKPEDENDTFTTNKFSLEESEMIDENWRKLCEKYDLPDQPISIFRYAIPRGKVYQKLVKTRYFIIAYLARGLKRTLYQVSRRCNTQFLYFNKGKYSATEEKITVAFLSNCTSLRSSVKELARLLNRPLKQIYKKLDEIRFGKEKPAVRRKWNLSRATKLLRGIMKCTKLPLEELKNRDIERSVWLHMEEKMQSKELNLSRFWYSNLHVQLFVQEDIEFRETLVHLFKILEKSPYKRWKDIKWKEIVKRFPDGFTWWFLYLNCYYRLRKTWAHKTMTVAEAARYFLTEGILLVKRRRLKRLRLNEKRQLEYIKKHT